jgi:hypothetical protein
MLASLLLVSSRLVSFLLGTQLWYMMRSVQRRSLSELLLLQKSQNSNGFFGERNEPNRFCFRFLFQRKKNSLFLFLQLWNHQLERERQSMMMILIYWKKKNKKKPRPKVEAISLIAQQLLLQIAILLVVKKSEGFVIARKNEAFFCRETIFFFFFQPATTAARRRTEHQQAAQHCSEIWDQRFLLFCSVRFLAPHLHCPYRSCCLQSPGSMDDTATSSAILCQRPVA